MARTMRACKEFAKIMDRVRKMKAALCEDVRWEEMITATVNCVKLFTSISSRNFEESETWSWTVPGRCVLCVES